MKLLHPKILQLRNNVGASPIKFAHRQTKLMQPVMDDEAGETDERLLKQYFCIWGIPDDYGTVPIKGCFSKSINERGPSSKSTFKIPALYMHNQRDTVGLPIVLIEDEIGLYAEVPCLEGVQVADELVIRHNAGVTNNGSYGFDYIWDKMEYDDANDVILMKECELFEISFVTIGAQTETYGVRNADGVFSDDSLESDTEKLIKKIARKEHLELRSIINRHITLAKSKPIETRQRSLEESKPKQEGVDYNYLIKNLKIK